MSDVRIAQAIRSLTDGLAPARPLRPVRQRLPLWALWSALGMAGVARLVGLRHDLPTGLATPSFLVQTLTMTALAVVAAGAALRLAVPGADRPRDRTASLALLIGWPLALLLWHEVGGGTAAAILGEPLHPSCMKTIATMSLLPALVLAGMIRRGTPLAPGRAAAMAGTAAAAIGAAGVALTCPIATVSHLLVAHALPALAIAALIGTATQAVIRASSPRPTRVLAAVALLWLASTGPLVAGQSAEQLPEFTVVATAGGYVPSDAFLDFLRTAGQGAPAPNELDGHGPLLVGAAILLGGLLLNLTPCVLPMIPVNLAIIGAGRSARSRRRGWVLGGAYGCAMAVVYGLLGGVVVATAGTFGVLNSSAWFNAAIAALFVVLGLAMFDVFTLDLSRWSAKIPVSDEGRGRVALAFVMGGVAALLAGACVAPVVIQVVALSSRLYAGGSHAALALPLILGVGMGLPWPFAGAGIAALPKPGPWMVRVKQGLGVCILLTALYYARETYLLARPPVEDRTATADGWERSLEEGLAAAQRQGKPVFLDVWATWCKNCGVMDATTFKDAGVRAALEGFVKVRFQAEDLERPDVSALLDRLDSAGLPTYAVLEPVDFDRP